MDNNTLQYYRTIGAVQSAVSHASSYDEAIQTGLHIILDNTEADYAVLWYADSSDAPVLRPYYWICPNDLTACRYEVGSGIVGKTYQSNKSQFIFDFKKDPDAQTAEIMTGIDISSLLCIPFSSDNGTLGCLEWIKTAEHGQFTEEEADLCQILTLMTEMELHENGPKRDLGEQKKVLLSVRGLQKSYLNGSTVLQVLKGVNLDVFEGEFLCFLGESGCGKSTVLNLIGGMDTADGGSVCFMGKEFVNADENDLTLYRRNNIGFIFQSYNLMPNLTAKQNLDLIAELVSDPMDTKEALGLVKMPEHKDHYPSELSGGQQQRISIARALVKKPKLILADEPTAALDYNTSIEVLSSLENALASGTTMIMVTHNEEITKMADRVIRFRNGQTYEVTVNRRKLKASELVW